MQVSNNFHFFLMVLHRWDCETDISWGEWNHYLIISFDVSLIWPKLDTNMVQRREISDGHYCDNFPSSTAKPPLYTVNAPHQRSHWRRWCDSTSKLIQSSKQKTQLGQSRCWRVKFRRYIQLSLSFRAQFATSIEYTQWECTQAVNYWNENFELVFFEPSAQWITI